MAKSVQTYIMNYPPTTLISLILQLPSPLSPIHHGSQTQRESFQLKSTQQLSKAWHLSVIGESTKAMDQTQAIPPPMPTLLPSPTPPGKSTIPTQEIMWEPRT